MTFIRAHNLKVRLGCGFLRTKEILKGVSFELRQGDRLALIGANGAGKSTLLQAIAGILPPSEGELHVDGHVSALFNLTVGLRRESSGRRNLILRNLISGHSMQSIRERLPNMEAFAGIGAAIDDPMETYSQGMMMRVAFAAATEFDPDVLLMDEWLGVGDALFRDKSRERMDRLVERSGVIVLATHNERLSKETCNLGLYLAEGATRFFGPIEECWATYLADVEAASNAERNPPLDASAASEPIPFPARRAAT